MNAKKERRVVDEKNQEKAVVGSQEKSLDAVFAAVFEWLPESSRKGQRAFGFNAHVDGLFGVRREGDGKHRQTVTDGPDRKGQPVSGGKAEKSFGVNPGQVGFNAAQIRLFNLDDPFHRMAQIISQVQAEPVGRRCVAPVEVVGGHRGEGKRLPGNLLDGELPGWVFQLFKPGSERLTGQTVADHNRVRQRHTVSHKQQDEQPKQLFPGWVLMGVMFPKRHKTSSTMVRLNNGWPEV